MIYKVLTLDDEIGETDQLVHALREYEKKNNVPLDVVSFSRPYEFLENYKGNADIVFLDIKMALMNGMEVAKKIREIDSDVMIVFITTCVQYAVDGYEVQAFDFIVKPIDEVTFAPKMDRMISYLRIHHTEESISLSRKNGMNLIPVSSILYVEVVDHDVIYHTSEEEIRVRRTLSSAAEELLPYHFSFCNACYLVNLKYVHSVEGSDVLVGNQRLAVSKAKKKAFLMDLASYYGGSK